MYASFNANTLRWLTDVCHAFNFATHTQMCVVLCMHIENVLYSFSVCLAACFFSVFPFLFRKFFFLSSSLQKSFLMSNNCVDVNTWLYAICSPPPALTPSPSLICEKRKSLFEEMKMFTFYLYLFYMEKRKLISLSFTSFYSSVHRLVYLLFSASPSVHQ